MKKDIKRIIEEIEKGLIKNYDYYSYFSFLQVKIGNNFIESEYNGLTNYISISVCGKNEYPNIEDFILQKISLDNIQNAIALERSDIEEEELGKIDMEKYLYTYSIYW